METDVLIVGGGLSGLALADHLKRDGEDFHLIEAMDRLGGRIHTKSLAGGAFDLGPAWFWPGQPRMAELVQRFGIPVFEQYATGDLIYQDQAGRVQRGRGFASMQGSCRLAGGMGQLVNALSGALPPERISTGTRLISLTYERSGIAASVLRKGQTQRIKAREVVLALPPRVIADTVAFEPGLEDAERKALEEIPTWMAGQAKVLAIYDEPHWRIEGLSGDAMSHRGPMVEIHDASPMVGGPYALFGFVGVPADARAGHVRDLKALALAQLTALFGPQMANPRELILQDWALLPEIARPSDFAPLASHPSYGLPASLRALGEKGIRFASTETAPVFGGFLEGALEAAERTIKAIRQPVGSGV